MLFLATQVLVLKAVLIILANLPNGRKIELAWLGCDLRANRLGKVRSGEQHFHAVCHYSSQEVRIWHAIWQLDTVCCRPTGNTMQGFRLHFILVGILCAILPQATDPNIRFIARCRAVQFIYELTKGNLPGLVHRLIFA